MVCFVLQAHITDGLGVGVELAARNQSAKFTALFSKCLTLCLTYFWG